MKALTISGLTAKDVEWLENKGYDYATDPHNVGGKTGQKLRHFDQFAQEFARENPGVIGSADDPAADLSAGFWEVLHERKGSTAKLYDRDVLSAAADMLARAREEAARQPEPEEELVPFSRRGRVLRYLRGRATQRIAGQAWVAYRRIRYGTPTDHAPKGGAQAGGKTFEGGQFIPRESAAAAGEGHEETGRRPEEQRAYDLGYDTADIGEARVFCVRTAAPLLIGELLPEDEAPIDGVTLSLDGGRVLCNIRWIDDPIFDVDHMLASLHAALSRHDAVRGAPGKDAPCSSKS